MTITISPNPRPVQTAESPSQEVRPQAPAVPAPQAPPANARLADTFEHAPASPQAHDPGPANYVAPAGFAPQPSPKGCGLANLAQVYRAATGDFSTPDKELYARIERSTEQINASADLQGLPRVNLEDGLTPEEMGALLGMQGQKVVKGWETFTSDTMRGALDNEGQLGLALLDSNAILPPGQRTEQAGGLHWVTIDQRENGLYRVKDPAQGEFLLTELELQEAVAKARRNTGSGGVMVAVNERNDVPLEARHVLARENLSHAAVLGKGNGGGSKSTSVIETS